MNTEKKVVVKVKPMFSCKRFLERQALRKLAKAQHRADKRAAKQQLEVGK